MSDAETQIAVLQANQANMKERVEKLEANQRYQIVTIIALFITITVNWVKANM